MGQTNEPVAAFYEAVELIRKDLVCGVNGELLVRDAKQLLDANDAMVRSNPDANIDDERCVAMRDLETQLLSRGINLREMALEAA